MSSRADSSSENAKTSETGGDAVKKGPWQAFRENVEAIVVAIILALIIRHFSLEAFEIPTGSMAPGLNGVHVETTCPNCGTISDVGVHTDPHSGAVSAHMQDRLIYSHDGIEDLPTKVGVRIRHPDPRVGYIDPVREGFRRAIVAGFDAWCPQCSLVYTELFEPSDWIGGHKILVNKFVYFLRSPRRWEVIVFKFNRQRNYIKRLIGLPGETIEVVDGDIWIDGKVARKPDHAQRHLWFAVHDSNLPERGFSRPLAWEPSAPRVWTDPADESTDAYQFQAMEGAGTLRYQRSITNQYAYNSAGRSNGLRPNGSSAPPHRTVAEDWWVRDLRVTADVTVGGRGSFELRIHNGDLTYRCRVPAGNGQPSHPVEFWVDDEAQRRTLERQQKNPSDHETEWRTKLAEFRAEGDAPPEDGAAEADRPTTTRARLISSVPHEVEFALVDRRMTLRLDGEVVGEFAFQEEGVHRIDGPAKSTASIHVAGVAGTLHRVRIDRDIHYTSSGDYEYAVHEPYQLADDEYFAMGDNSPSSLDSRAWGPVAAENMLGRAFATFWPAWPWRFEIGFIR